MTALGILALLAIAGAYAFTRLYLPARFGWVGSDAYYQFVLGGLVRERGLRGLVNDRFLVPERVDYPPLVPWLVSLVPPRWLRALQYTAPLADAVCLAVVAAAAWSWWGGRAALVAALAYASTPHAFDIAYAFSPRPLGNLLLTLALLALLSSGDASAPGVLAASVLGALVLLTHRLTTQSFVACLLAYAVIDPLATLAVLCVAGMLAVAASGGYYVRSAGGHLAFLRAMGTGALTRRSWARGLALVLRGSPHLLSVGVAALTAGMPAGRPGVMLLWIGALLLLGAFWPFGEGDRHLANASGPVALFLGGASHSALSGAVLALTASAGLALIGLKLLLYPRMARGGVNTVVTRALREGCEQIRARRRGGERPLIAVWPQQLSYQVMYFADARVVLASGGTGSGLAYNKRLEARVSREGLGSLSGEEQPEFLLRVGSEMRIPEGNWEPIYRRDGVGAYALRHQRSPVAGRRLGTGAVRGGAGCGWTDRPRDKSL